MPDYSRTELSRDIEQRLLALEARIQELEAAQAQPVYDNPLQALVEAPEPKKRFEPPTSVELADHFREIDQRFTAETALAWAEVVWNFYASKNWMVGKNKMTRWKSVASNSLAWEGCPIKAIAAVAPEPVKPAEYVPPRNRLVEQIRRESELKAVEIPAEFREARKKLIALLDSDRRSVRIDEGLTRAGEVLE